MKFFDKILGKIVDSCPCCGNSIFTILHCGIIGINAIIHYCEFCGYIVSMYAYCSLCDEYVLITFSNYDETLKTFKCSKCGSNVMTFEEYLKCLDYINTHRMIKQQMFRQQPQL